MEWNKLSMEWRLASTKVVSEREALAFRFSPPSRAVEAEARKAALATRATAQTRHPWAVSRN